jgi:putative ABC transport system substrate-binding protein
MRRRDFIAGLGSVAAWPLTARARQPLMPAVGLLHSGKEEFNKDTVNAFRQGLVEAGFVEGRNVAIVIRWANTQFGRLRSLATDLVQREVAVLVAAGGTVRAAKAATETIPIVAVGSIDLEKYGFVASLSRPGGNVTGITFMTGELIGKRLDLLHQMVPDTTTIGFLANANDNATEEQTSYLLEAARLLQCKIIVVQCRSDRDFESAFATLKDRNAGALVIGDSAFFSNNNRGRIIALAALYKIPTIYPSSGYVRSGGGLISYDADRRGGFRQAGAFYVARILRGARPADLPVQRPTKLELVINLKTAKALGLTIPETLLATADEVIQ